MEKVRNLLRNATILTSSTGFTAVCGVASLAINARALGPADFGVLSVIQAYTALIAGLMAFESWLPIVRFSIRSPGRLSLNLSCGFALDASAAATATVVAIGGIVLFGDAIGLTNEHQVLGIIYSASLLAGLTGAPKGYFRLRGRYDVLATNQVAQGLAILAASAALAAMDADLFTYITIFAIVAGIYNLSLLARLWLVANEEQLRLLHVFSTSSRRRYFLAFFSMAAGTSLLSTLLTTRRHVALLLTTSIVGEAAAGIYAAAARVAAMVSRLTVPLSQVLFPEILRAAQSSSSSQWAGLALRMTLGAAAASILLAAVGIAFREPIMLLVAGPAYAASAFVFSILITAECVVLAGVHLNPLIQSSVGTGPLIKVAAAATLLYFPLAWTLAHSAAVPGMASAELCTALAMYFGMLLTANKVVRSRQDRTA